MSIIIKSTKFSNHLFGGDDSQYLSFLTASNKSENVLTVRLMFLYLQKSPLKCNTAAEDFFAVFFIFIHIKNKRWSDCSRRLKPRGPQIPVLLGHASTSSESNVTSVFISNFRTPACYRASFVE